MSVKELTDITLTDLWKEFNSIRGGERQKEVVKEFRRIFIGIRKCNNSEQGTPQ